MSNVSKASSSVKKKRSIVSKRGGV